MSRAEGDAPFGRKTIGSPQCAGPLLPRINGGPSEGASAFGPRGRDAQVGRCERETASAPGDHGPGMGLCGVQGSPEGELPR